MDPLDDRGLSRRGFLGLAAAAAAGVTLGACGSDPKVKGAAATTTTTGAAETAPAGLAGGRTATVRTCVYAKNHASSMLFWQKFAPPGITVSVTPVTSTAEVLQALEGGSLDFGLMSPYVPMLTQAKTGITCKTVGMVARRGFGLIGKAGVVSKVEELRGKKIAIPPPGSFVLVATLVLQQAGLTLGKDVEVVPLGYADHLTALTRGDVDAFMGSEPPSTQAVVDGVGVRLPGVFDTPLGDMNTALWASAAVLKDEELVRVATRMQKDAAEHLTPGGQNDPDVWRDLLVGQFGFEERLATAVLDNVGAEWRFDAKREAQYAGVGEALVATGDLAAEPDYEALYARQFWTV